MDYPKDQPKAWLFDHVIDAVQYLSDEHKVTTLTEMSMGVASDFPSYLDIALRELRRVGHEAEASSLEGFRQKCMDLQNLVLEEQSAGYPLLWKHSTVSLWTILETASEGLILNLIQGVKDSDEIILESESKVEIPKYFNPLDRNRCRALFNNWQRELSSTNIAERYMEMLGTFEINVDVNSDDKENIAELAEARNIILHRRSKVDKRFITKCPRTKYNVDDLYHVSRNDYVRFWDATAAMMQSMVKGIVESPW